MNDLLRTLTTVFAAALLAACGAEPPPVDAPLPVPPGDAVPPEVEAMLYGSTQTCGRDAQCAGGVCYYGSCVGLLIAEQRWMQEAITAELAAALERTPALRPRVVSRLEAVLDRSNTDLAFRARSLVPLEALGEEEPIARAMGLGDERLEAAAALALCRLGDRRGLPLTSALTEHPTGVLAAEALAALGKSSLDDALVPLLRTLSADLDGGLVRVAIGALGELGDRRAVRPLVAFLDDGPEFLQHRVVTALRTLVPDGPGFDVAAWRAWVEREAPPAPPSYTPREDTPDDDLGLPAP